MQLLKFLFRHFVAERFRDLRALWCGEEFIYIRQPDSTAWGGEGYYVRRSALTEGDIAAMKENEGR